MRAVRWMKLSITCAMLLILSIARSLFTENYERTQKKCENCLMDTLPGSRPRRPEKKNQVQIFQFEKFQQSI